MNEDFVDNTISNLKIVAMVQKNQKLCVRKGQLTIEKGDRMQFVRRWIHNDSRDVIIMHVRNTVNNAIRIARSLIDGTAGPCTQFQEWTLMRITQELEAACHGLVNLKTTYAGDSIMIANLETLGDRIKVNCDDIQRHVDLKHPL